MSWGPENNAKPTISARPGPRWTFFLLGGSGAIVATYGGDSGPLWIAFFAMLVVIDRVVRRSIRRASVRPPRTADQLDAGDPLGSARRLARAAGGGAYLGVSGEGRLAFSAAQRAVLLLGPPRSGKTSSVIIPSVICHVGPVVSTSTKPDVMRATAPVRGRDGKVWVFDPTGSDYVAAEQQLRWSPLACSAEWDGAQLMARAMVATVGAGVSDRSHWARRAQALLAPMLHAAARGERDMEQVVGWVMSHELDEPAGLLEHNHASRLAVGSLIGIAKTAERERSSIFSAAADALDAYTTRAGIQTTKRVNFDAEQFVASRDTIYIHAPAEHQQAVAPIVCSLLAEIRRQTYLAYRHGRLPAPVFFCLDEVANIAPVEELPSIASEGGGQGLKLLAALQDLSQARNRWGAQADGFLTLFGVKLILPGVADQRTLESISVALGEYDRQTIARTGPSGPSLTAAITGTPQPRATQTVSTQRQRVLSPGEIANIPAGHALALNGVQWALVTVTPAHASQPWAALTTAQA